MFWLRNKKSSDSVTILGLWVLGLDVSYTNGSTGNCKLMSPEHFDTHNTIASWDSLKSVILFGNFFGLIYGSHSQSINGFYFPNFMYFSTYFPNFNKYFPNVTEKIAS